ncbi:MAG: SDR family NAD(P)-dependent oxidoreductase [Bacilli bacterium]|nr:SDR family NAD(P)-dependent oxidoreductase [Bacilli bacterium]
MKEIIVITGGTSGLGYELVIQAIERGYCVCNIARNKEKMLKMSQQFTDNYHGFIGDISDDKFIKDTFNEIKKIGNVICLINGAEKACFKKATLYDVNDIDMSLTGLKGMILCSTEALKIKGEKDLKIVNIMSSAALKGNKNETLYCACKCGERGYTESLKSEYKGTSVKIIGVYPGGMNTSFWNENRDYVSEEKAMTFMNPKEVAEVILDNILNYSNLTVADIIIERK